MSSSDRLATAFRFFDEDGSGAISADELVEGLNFDDDGDAEDKMDLPLAEAIMNEIQSDLEELSFKNFILLINHYHA